MSTIPDLNAVKAYLGDSSWSDEEIGAALVAECAAQAHRCRIPAHPSADADAYADYPVTDSEGGNVDWADPVVTATSGDEDPVTIEAEWQGDPAPTRDLRVPTADLGHGAWTLTLSIASENDLTLGTYVTGYLPSDLAEALKRRVARNLAMRSLPLGVQSDELGATRVGSVDPEVRRLEGPYRRLAVG